MLMITDVHAHALLHCMLLHCLLLMMFGCAFHPEIISLWRLGAAPLGLPVLLQNSNTLWLRDTALSHCNWNRQADHRLQSTDTLICAGHELVCLVLGWIPSTACALLEFAEAPIRILRFLYPVDIGITTATSPALDIAWPAAIFTQNLTSDSCQLHVSLQQTHYS